MALKFADKFPQLKSNYSFPWHFYIRLALRCSILKTLWYSIRFRGVVMVGRGTKLRVHRSSRIVLAPRSLLAVGLANDAPSGAALRIYPRSQMHVSGRVQIMRACNVIVGYDATLRVGAGTFFNDGSFLTCYSTTTIGSGCAIASGARILDSDLHQLLRNGRGSPHSPVQIGQDCWIGTNAIILKGVRLGSGAVVAAGAVVTSDVPARSLVAGSARRRSSVRMSTGCCEAPCLPGLTLRSA